MFSPCIKHRVSSQLYNVGIVIKYDNPSVHHIPKSTSSLHNHDSLHATTIAHMYSEFVLDMTIVDFFLLLQVITTLPKENKAIVDFFLLLQLEIVPLQSTFVYPYKAPMAHVLHKIAHSQM